MFVNVEFDSQQAVLRGRLYRPEGAGPFPVVIMAHGTSATVAMTTDRYAEAFRAAGLAVLLYDHRNFGASGGEPRQEINPWVQARGYRDAMTYLESAPGVDPDAIAIWGDSYSAAEVIVVGAVDERPAAVVAQVPAMGPHFPPPDPDGSLFAALCDTLLQGPIDNEPAETTGPLPVVSPDQLGTPSLLTPIQAFRWFIEGPRRGRFSVSDAGPLKPVSDPATAPARHVQTSWTPRLDLVDERSRDGKRQPHSVGAHPEIMTGRKQPPGLNGKHERCSPTPTDVGRGGRIS